MSIKSIISATLSFIRGLGKEQLIAIIDELRKRYSSLLKKNEELSATNEELLAEIKRLKGLEVETKIKQVNQQSNKPSSKQAEWEEKGVGNDRLGKKKGRGKKGRKGAGNKPKNKEVTKKETVKVDRCNICGKEFSNQAALKSVNTRIITDIPAAPAELEIIEVKQEKQYCKNCKIVLTAKSDLALSGADTGLNTTVKIIFLWVGLGLPFTRIKIYLSNFFSLSFSTAGLSKQVIRVSKIMESVYEEILEDIKTSKLIHADETGWRVNGKKWWMWVVGNYESAYYRIDKSRGKDVVRKMLGEIFMGVLVVDGWSAYLSLMCEQQSCMAHLLRKIRKLYAAFPELKSVHSFYIRFRRILRDGERLQDKRSELEEFVFKRRLDKLHKRLDNLLEWPDANEVLGIVIKKVKKQRPRILTFVEHPGVPCHNNFGEYLIRIGVLKRKISFGSKSAEGATAYAILLSVYTTCKLRKISFLDFLKQSLQLYTQTGKPLLLKEYMAKQNQHNKAA